MLFEQKKSDTWNIGEVNYIGRQNETTKEDLFSLAAQQNRKCWIAKKIAHFTLSRQKTFLIEHFS